MKPQTRAVILLQFLKNTEAFAFGSPLLTVLEQEKKENDLIFSVDNFSDSLTVHYAKQLMDESSEILLICDLNGADQTGSLQTILNYGVKKKNVKLVSVGENPLLKPFFIALKGKMVKSAEELKTFL